MYSVIKILDNALTKTSFESLMRINCIEDEILVRIGVQVGTWNRIERTGFLNSILLLAFVAHDYNYFIVIRDSKMFNRYIIIYCITSSLRCLLHFHCLTRSCQCQVRSRKSHVVWHPSSYLAPKCYSRELGRCLFGRVHFS